MKLVKETTIWKDVKRQPNHTYLTSDSMDKIYAYFKWHNPKDFVMLKTPLRIDRRYRTFKVIQSGIKDLK
jgi:hypothetical protein